MPSKRISDRDIAYLVAEHQANLILLAGTWASDVLDLVKSSENELLGALAGLLDAAGEATFSSRTIAKYQALQKAVLSLRAAGFNSALDYAIRQSAALAENEAKWAAAMVRAQSGLKATKQIKQKLDSIVNFAFVNDGKTISESFEQAKIDDAARITAICRDGMRQGKAIDEIAKEIRGTKDYNYADGTLEISRKDAARIARTVCCGIADEAKMQFYLENQDVIFGVRHIATLSSNTCLVCASLDGRVWRIPEEVAQIPKLGIHDNCRCVHIPITEMDEVNSSTRPAEEENFWQEAEDFYKKKYPKGDWNSLSRSTRLKYYYQVQKDYEKRTGKPAFEQVPQNMSFKDWLKTKSPEYVQEYLGPTRYKLYIDGKLPLSRFVNPETNKLFTIKELKQRDIESFQKAGLTSNR